MFQDLATVVNSQLKAYYGHLSKINLLEIIFLQSFLKNNFIETTFILLEKLVKIKGKVSEMEKYRHL